MKYFLVISLLFFVSTVIFSQNGYREYTWGMTIDQVREKSADLTQKQLVRWASPQNAIMFLYNSEFSSTIPNPLSYETGTITTYESKSNDIIFYFLNGILISAEITFWQENILTELRRQHGNVTPLSASFGNYRFQTATWNREANRIIVWEINAPLEYVTYIDKNWLNPLMNRTMTIFRNQRDESRSRLD